MISRKGRVSLAKVTGRSGKFIFGPLDRDLRAQDEGMRRSNLERPSGIGWSGGVRARRAAAGHRRSSAPRRASPATADPALQGSVRAAVWPWSTSAARVIYLGTQNGGLGFGQGSPRRGAALGGGARRGAACRPLCGSDARAKGPCDLRKARLACAGVVRGCRAADIRHGGAAAARRRRARSRLLGAPRAKLASAKAKEDRASAHRGLEMGKGPAQGC